MAPVAFDLPFSERRLKLFPKDPIRDPNKDPRVLKFETLPSYEGGEPIILIFQVPPPSIGYLTSIVEASEGIGLVRTLDESRGIIECWTMPDAYEDFTNLMDAFGKEYPVQPLDREFD